MDIALLASAAAALIAQGFLSEAGASTWASVERMVVTIRDRFTGESSAQAALERVQAQPEDEASVDQLAIQVARAMQSDTDFADMVKDFVECEGRDPRGSQVISRVYNDYKGAQIGKVVNVETVHGDMNF
ncbi:hypothetical protein [Nonomuraea solani]|uniref:hypothetical protein n=1 Tax=Nonomuraea solani TaxID=1144553 RepID=UPI0011AFD45A|nr:hypothetical protein [Nonomuraea solani]